MIIINITIIGPHESLLHYFLFEIVDGFTG